VLPDSLLFPCRPQVQVILEQLPLHLPTPLSEPVLQLARGQPGRRGPFQLRDQRGEQIRRGSEGTATRIWAYGSTGLFFRPVRLGWHLRT